MTNLEAHLKLRLVLALALVAGVAPGFMAHASKEDSAFSGLAVLDSANGESLSIEGISTSTGKEMGTATYIRAGVARSIKLDCVEFEPGSETHTIVGGDLRASGTTIGVTGESHTARIRITGIFGRFDASGRAGISWDGEPRGLCGADDVPTERPEFGQFLFVRPVLGSGI